MELVKPKLIVMSAPSGSGKTSVFKGARAALPNLMFSISYTTRSPRDGETDGVDYFFVDREVFLSMIKADQFLEWAEVYGNYYGTSKPFIQQAQQAGKIVVLDIDVQGAMQLRRQTDLDAVFIFIMPPSLDVLSERLIARGTEDSTSLHRRLGNAEEEMSYRNQYDYQIVNDDLETAVDDFLRVVIRECYDVAADQDLDRVIKQLRQA